MFFIPVKFVVGILASKFRCIFRERKKEEGIVLSISKKYKS